MSGYDHLTLAILGVLTLGPQTLDGMVRWLTMDNPAPPDRDSIEVAVAILLKDGRAVAIDSPRHDGRYALVIR